MRNSFVILKFKGNLKIKCMEILVHSLRFKKKIKTAQKMWINQLKLSMNVLLYLISSTEHIWWEIVVRSLISYKQIFKVSMTDVFVSLLIIVLIETKFMMGSTNVTIGDIKKIYHGIFKQYHTPIMKNTMK